MRGTFTYKTLEVLGPEHEYSLVDKDLNILPISDKIIKSYCGRIINFIELPKFTFGKEMQLHVMELKANKPFENPAVFEETMQEAVSSLNTIIEKYGAKLLGTGMHPLLKLSDTAIWPHYHKKIYNEYAKIFNLNQHGWLNIQSFHLNLPYKKESDAIKIHNHLANLSAYLPAITASSPIFEGKVGPDTDNRLSFYKVNQREVPSITGDVIPEYINSIDMYKKQIFDRYSKDLANLGANSALLNREWVNSRGVIFRFDRRALEVRVIDEQECIKSDVALACFIRASLKGMLETEAELSPHEVLINDFNNIIKYGLKAEVHNENGKNAQQVCQRYFDLAMKYADSEEKSYLWLIKRRIDEGNLSDIIRAKVARRAQKTIYTEAILDVYSTLIRCLHNNEPYF